MNTPGPWIVFHADEDGPNDILPAGRPGCIAQKIENEADARLIAAAPDLLVALQAMVTWMSSGFAPQAQDRAMQMAHAAIAKACG